MKSISSTAKLVTVVAAASLLVAGLAGCGSGSTKPNAATRTLTDLVSTTAPATKDVSAVTWNLPYEPASLDPIKTQVFADAPVTSNVCESLFRVGSDLDISPNLATSYKQVDPLTWTYQLRSDVTFWDGSPMTSADVVASLERNIDPNSGSYWGLEFENVSSITAAGPNAFTIHLTKPDALVNQVLATSAGAISEASFLAKAGASYGSAKTGLMCTGPFRFDSWTAGSDIVISRNDGYWDKSLKAKVGKITFRFVSDPSTTSSGLISEEIDGMYQVPGAAIPALRKSSSGTLYLGPSTASLDLIPTERSGPLQNPKVREALFIALDRSAVAKNVYNDAATPAVSFINPGVGYGKSVFAGYLKSRPAPTVDQAKAKTLVKQAELADSTIKLATSPDPSLETVANAIAAAGNQIGLKITVVTLTAAENDQLYFDQKLRDQYDGFLNVQWTLTTDPLEELEFITKGAFTNYGLYYNTKFQQAFYSALGVTDPKERAVAAVKAVTIADHDLPWVPIVNLPVATYVSNKLTGFPTSWAFLYGGWARSLGGK
ncbi:MAG: ABC transporter substrate-binding protein [Microbacteriaceae bacterium]|nr:MAG: ABC transporter substrate-binding protein [Microbacteriaceae bacterium]